MKTLLLALPCLALLSLQWGAPEPLPARERAVQVAHNPDGGKKKKDDEEGEEDLAPAPASSPSAEA